MTSRDNESRFAAPGSGTAEEEEEFFTDEPTPEREPLSFVVPTELVDLPSKGQFYGTGHPLSGQEAVEIRYMTAKEEDILTSRSLLEKGLALDRLITSVLVDKRVKASTLLTGDRNAILIAARKSGYGADYNTTIVCPSCSESDTHTYNLEDASAVTSPTPEVLEELGVQLNSAGNFEVTLPSNPVRVEFKLLTGRDETYLLKSISAKQKKRTLTDTLVTDQLKLMIVSVNDYTDKELLAQFVDTMTLTDSRFVRELQQQVTPNVELRKDFVCENCDHEDDIKFPFTVDFFWPQR